MTQNGNKCPTEPDIRNAERCPTEPDITSLTISRRILSDPKASALLKWSTPTVEEIPWSDHWRGIYGELGRVAA
jgi:hypothetical protein